MLMTSCFQATNMNTSLHLLNILIKIDVFFRLTLTSKSTVYSPDFWLLVLSLIMFSSVAQLLEWKLTFLGNSQPVTKYLFKT